MEITVEISNDEQRRLIEAELTMFMAPVLRDGAVPILDQIIVASDLGARVNELEGTTTYQANRRSANALARVASYAQGCAIVLSPVLYSEWNDTQTRYFVIAHELYHVICAQRRQPVPDADSAQGSYVKSLRFMYEEYCADRFAYGMIDEVFPEKSSHWVALYNDQTEGIRAALADRTTYDFLRDNIREFRRHRDVTRLMEKIWGYIDDTSVLLTHVFAAHHHSPGRFLPSSLGRSPFVNERTYALMECFRESYETQVASLPDRVELITEFLANFGIKLSDAQYGLYVDVLDI